MENLTRDYFTRLQTRFPEAVEHFFSWFERYMVEVGWDELFGQNEHDRVIGFYEIPYEMQNGILARFDFEKFNGAGAYSNAKINELTRYEDLFADVQRAVDNRSIKLN